MPPDPPIMQCTLQLHTMLNTLTQNLPDQSKFASYTPDNVAKFNGNSEAIGA